ncbi:LysM peptidoglycan-binding domain-containing protein [Anaerolineales bacterium HSG24]|nr:LysM peptidoglycan-binding domain-containing protein [Anaerolineales bacterium HSG24]
MDRPSLNYLQDNAWWMLSVVGLVVILFVVLGQVTSQVDNVPIDDVSIDDVPINDVSINDVPINNEVGQAEATPVAIIETETVPDIAPIIPLVTVTYYKFLGIPDMAPLYAPQPASFDELQLPPTSTATPTVPPTPTVTPTSTPNLPIHRVKRGEILASIALEYGITTESILLVNHLDDADEITIGKKLYIPENPIKTLTYKHLLVPGETLLGVAARYRSSVDDILDANPVIKPKRLKYGILITIPVIFSLEPTPQPIISPTPRFHVVQAGESPLVIANVYNISVEMLLAANQIVNPRRLRIGTTLTVPPPDGLTLGVPVMVHEIKTGESLIGIVSKYGSSIRDVLFTNPKFKPDQLKIGELVAIPIVFPPERRKPKSSTAILTPPQVDELATEAVEALNVERQANKLRPLKVDDRLSIAAIGHAQDMVVRDFFAHVNPDGITLRQRLIANGFPATVRAGENIQCNAQPASRTIDVTIQWLMNSPPHRKNMLHRNYNHVGVGVVEYKGVYTIVMDFSE